MASPVVVAYILLVLVYSVDGNGNDNCSEWDYEGTVLGPDHWSDEFPECGKTSQSPINIDTKKVMYDPLLKSFNLDAYAAILLDPWYHTMKLENTGHTVTLTYSDETPVVISSGSLPDNYVLDQLHFHWGSCNDSGSEHQIDGQSELMEMHIVHRRAKFPREASAEKPGGLAVLAFLFKIGSHNFALDVLLSYIKKVTYKTQQVDVQSFDLHNLLMKEGQPSYSYYYRYNGSLTTPPCYQTVIWSVFATKLELSAKQLEVFRTLRGATGDQHISDNFRPVQPLNSRQVYSNDPAYSHTAPAPLPLMPVPLPLPFSNYYFPHDYHDY